MRLLDLSRETRVPLALAVIPMSAQAEAFDCLPVTVTLLQHGVDHRNRAAAGEKKTEFPPSEPVEEALARLVSGREKLAHIADGRILPLLVPPWNRLSSPELLGRLVSAGFLGLSRFGPRATLDAAPGLVAINTHVDIIDWRGSRGFAGEDLVLAQATRHLQARRSGATDAGESTGWLTHHAVHDPACWAFLHTLMERTSSCEGLRWSAIQLLLADAQRT
ncbi:MAG: hypothetical protein ABI343_19830 [Burkholderiaceae bacterium]